MSESLRPPTARAAAIALAVTLLIQIYTSVSGTAAAVLAPEIAPEFGLSPKLVGVFVGFVYAGSMSASLVSGGFIERFGAIRVSQACVLFCALGVALLASTPTGVPVALLLLVLAPLVIGIGYGPITPASSHVLARTTPPARMALMFSIKQTGVPAGTALGGAVLPALALAFGWRAALAGIVALGLMIAVSAQTTRDDLDSDRHPARSVSLARAFAPLKVLFRNRELVELSVTGLIYASTQVCLVSFLVVYLTEALGFSLVTAGIALTTANIGGIVGRIGFGAVADRLLPPRKTLGVVGVIAALCAFTTMTFDSSWPPLALLGVCAVFGMTAIGWNGVQLSEIARHAGPGQAGAMTGASGFLTFGGVVMGPPTFALLASLTGSYRVGFAVFGTLSLLAACRLLFWSQR
jgi:predicted MFS family arabinose efflux permease